MQYTCNPIRYAIHILVYATFSAVLFTACSSSKKANKPTPSNQSSSAAANPKAKTFIAPVPIDRNAFVAFAKKQLGIPYKYGSAVPANGLDCSGFVYYVFGHFNIKAPRTTVSFTNEGRQISENNARPGDLILFTGSDNSTGIVVHIGIITQNTNGQITFVHSASGKNIGVILNTLTGYYRQHFVKIISVFA